MAASFRAMVAAARPCSCRPALQLQFRNVADNLGTLHICQLVFRNGKRLAEDPQIPLIGNPGIVRKAKLYLQIFHK